MAGMLTKEMSPAYMAYEKLTKDDDKPSATPEQSLEVEMEMKRKRMGGRKSAAGMLAEGEQKPKKASAMLTGE